MTRDRDTTSAACAATSAGVPDCGTGPVGRVAFVARELADLWRELRGNARRTPAPDVDKDIEK